MRALVVCSHGDGGIDGQDFPKQRRMLRKLGTYSFTFVSPKAPLRDGYIRGFFPGDVPRIKYDLIWFCVCHGIYAEWSILDVGASLRRLKDDGLVVFTERPHIIGDFPHHLNIEIGARRGSIVDIRAYEDHLAREMQESMRLYNEHEDPDKLETLQYFTDMLTGTMKIREKFTQKFRRIHRGRRAGFYKRR